MVHYVLLILSQKSLPSLDHAYQQIAQECVCGINHVRESPREVVSFDVLP